MRVRTGKIDYRRGDHLVASPAHDDRSQRADVIDADSVQQHGDHMIAIAEIDENRTSDACFAARSRIM
jgi:hypothetical protein